MNCSIVAILSIVLLGYCSGECPTGWVGNQHSCYLYFHEKYTFFEAKVACDIAEAHLVEVDSQPEQTFVHNLVLNKNGGGYIWMGLEDFIIEGQYMWAGSRTQPEFFQWAAGDPNNYHNKEDCVAMERGPGGNWHDMDCENAYPFLCERMPDEGVPIGK